MSFGSYVEDKVLDHVLGKASWTPGGIVYVALATAVSGDGSVFTEVPFTFNYARKAVANTIGPWSIASGGSKSNGTPIQFNVASASWGTITHFGVFSTITGATNLYIWGLLGSPLLVTSGMSPVFQVGALAGTLS